MKKVLLTGVDGNLGRAILNESNFEIVALGRSDWAQLDQLMSSNVDFVIHAAADLRTSIAIDPESILDSNLMTTTKLLKSMQKNGVKKIIFISSCAVYGAAMNTNENTEPRPTSINGIAKLLCERVIEAFCKANRIEFIFLRVFNTFGERDRFSVLHHLKEAVLQSKPFNLNNNGLAQRDFIHVNDVARIIKGIAEAEISNIPINVGTGISTRILDIVNEFEYNFPALKIQHQKTAEAEYSRANVDLLRSLVTIKPQAVMDFVKHSFIPQIKIQS